MRARRWLSPRLHCLPCCDDLRSSASPKCRVVMSAVEGMERGLCRRSTDIIGGRRFSECVIITHYDPPQEFATCPIASCAQLPEMSGVFQRLVAPPDSCQTRQ